MTRALVALGLSLILAGTTVGAEPSLLAELDTLATRYHQDPARLDVVREGLTRAVEREARVETLIGLARVSFIWGDVRAATPEAKLDAYDHGRRAARRAVDQAPKNVAARFWYAANTGRWGQANGVVRSLFLLPDVRREIKTILDLDPTFTPVYALAGNVLYEVPGLLGGDLARAEEMFKKGLEQDPRFTGMRVGLAKTLIKLGRQAEARQQLQTVLDEAAPSNPADWTLKDSPEARRLLGSLTGRS